MSYALRFLFKQHTPYLCFVSTLLKTGDFLLAHVQNVSRQIENMPPMIQLYKPVLKSEQKPSHISPGSLNNLRLQS